MSRNVVITGHTSGIGEAITDLLDRNGDTVLGISRGTGIDLSTTSGRNHALMTTIREDADVFINNAHVGDCQMFFLKNLAKLWQNTDKMIITISSRISDNVVPIQDNNGVQEYAAYKAGLDHMCRTLYAQPGAPRIVNIRPGMTDTERVATHPGPRLDPYDVAQVVEWVMNRPRNALIPSITVVHWDETGI